MPLLRHIAINIAAALMAAAFMCSPASAEEPIVLDRIVAVVNNEAVTWIELYEDMKRELAPALLRMSEDEKRAALKQAESSHLDRMIVKLVQIQRAEELGIEATQMDVDMALRNIRTKYSMDEEAFRAAIKSEGLTMEQYRQVLSEQITIGRVADRDARSGLEGDEAAIRREAERLGVTSTSYRLRQIFFRMAEDGSNFGDVKARVQQVYSELKAGRDFGAVAAAYSEGPTAKDGGDLGYISESDMSDLFKEHVLKLAPGAFTEPIPTGTGVHILMLQDRLEPAQFVMQEAMDKAHQRWLGGLLDSAYIDIRL